MKMHGVVSGLAVAAVMLATGAALSDSVATSPAQLVSFNRHTGELWALPDGQAVTPYLNQNVTSYLAADLSRYVPPDPCLPPAQAWNFTTEYDQITGQKSTFVFELLLGVMSELSCGANVTSVTEGTPQPLVAIRPSK